MIHDNDIIWNPISIIDDRACVKLKLVIQCNCVTV